MIGLLENWCFTNKQGNLKQKMAFQEAKLRQVCIQSHKYKLGPISYHMWRPFKIDYRCKNIKISLWMWNRTQEENPCHRVPGKDLAEKTPNKNCNWRTREGGILQFKISCSSKDMDENWDDKSGVGEKLEIHISDKAFLWNIRKTSNVSQKVVIETSERFRVCFSRGQW